MTLGPILHPEIIHVTKDNNTILLALKIPENLAYLEGHFTNSPLVPGVVQLHWAVIYSRQYFDLNPTGPSLEVGQASQIKFSYPIFPNKEILLTLVHHPEKRTIIFEYTSKSNSEIDITHSKGRFQYV